MPARTQPAAAASAGEVVKGYRLLRVPLAPGSPVARGLLVKRHESRDAAEKEAAKRTLFVTHLDNFATELQLQRCFAGAFGQVEKVELKAVEKKAPRAELRADHVSVYVSFARVVFKEADGVDKALAASTGRVAGSAVLPPPHAELKECLRASKTLYRDPVELRREIDEWMAGYDQKEEEKRRLAQETAVDEDGFTKVVSGITRTTDGLTIRSAARPAVKTGAFAEPVKGVRDTAVEMKNKGKKNKEMPDFYRFQLREQRRGEIVDHRKRKAADEEKVEYMKKKKKFKAQA